MSFLIHSLKKRRSAWRMVAAPGTDLEHLAAEALRDFADLVECHTVPLTGETRVLYRALGVRERGFYLIRPDQYIACRGQGLEAGGFRRYLATCLRPVPAESP